MPGVFPQADRMYIIATEAGTFTVTIEIKDENDKVLVTNNFTFEAIFVPVLDAEIVSYSPANPGSGRKVNSDVTVTIETTKPIVEGDWNRIGNTLVYTRVFISNTEVAEICELDNDDVCIDIDVDITWIDKVLFDYELEFDRNTLSNQPITATITLTKDVIVSGWTRVEDTNSWTKTFTQDNELPTPAIVLIDQTGKMLVIEVDTNLLDTTDPIISVTNVSTNQQTGFVTVTIETTKEIIEGDWNRIGNTLVHTRVFTSNTEVAEICELDNDDVCIDRYRYYLDR